MIPDLEKESANPGLASNLNVVQDYHHGLLGPRGLPQHSAASSSRSDVPRLGSFMPTDISIATEGTSTRYAPRREEGPWLADLSRQYTPPQQTSAQPTPRISSLSYLPRIRVGDSARRPQHLPPDAWTFSQKSFAAAAAPLPSDSSPLPASGHPHATFDMHSPSDFARVKHEPDADLSMPPLMRTGPGWTYVTPHSPSAPHMSVPFFYFTNSHDIP
jgi:hypothetical protein